MNVLITAGNTQVLIDRVRCLTNIFTGRTGAGIAWAAHARGHSVRLLTSHPETAPEPEVDAERWQVQQFRTFDELRELMGPELRNRPPDALIHCAAISDYLAAGVYSPDAHTHFRPDGCRWEVDSGHSPRMIDRTAPKIKSIQQELWIRLTPAPKLIDLVRTEWRFQGLIVKFKLEVGTSDEQLLRIAERSRRFSSADLMVANTLEGASQVAFIGPVKGAYHRVAREALADRLIAEVERLFENKADG